jgi:hypothetical protein
VKEVRIPFRNWELVAWANEQGPDAMIAIKPICEAIGIDSRSQIVKIKGTPCFSWCDITSTGSDGKQYQMVALPVKQLNGWLFGVSSKRVKPEVAGLLLEFQQYCFDAIYAAVSGTANTLVVAELVRRIDVLTAQVSMLLKDNADLRADLRELRDGSHYLGSIEASNAGRRLRAQRSLKLVQ